MDTMPFPGDFALRATACTVLIADVHNKSAFGTGSVLVVDARSVRFTDSETRLHE